MNKFKTTEFMLFVIMASSVVMLLISSCAKKENPVAPASGGSSTPAIVGTWTNLSGFGYTFNADKTFLMFSGSTNEYKGTWDVSGDRLTINCTHEWNGTNWIADTETMIFTYCIIDNNKLFGWTDDYPLFTRQSGSSGLSGTWKNYLAESSGSSLDEDEQYENFYGSSNIYSEYTNGSLYTYFQGPYTYSSESNIIRRGIVTNGNTVWVETNWLWQLDNNHILECIYEDKTPFSEMYLTRQ